MTKQTFFIFGPPGSGKGTQARLLQDKLGCLYFSSGDYIRQEMGRESVLGQQLASTVNSGKMAPNEIVNQLAENYLKSHQAEIQEKGLIFDGYPRNIAQIEKLNEYLKKYHLPSVKAIYIKLTDKGVIERLEKRRVCQKCQQIYMPPESLTLSVCRRCGGKISQREDDQPKLIKKRLADFHRLTKLVIEYFRSRHQLIEVDGQGEIGAIHQDVIKKLGVEQ